MPRAQGPRCLEYLAREVNRRIGPNDHARHVYIYSFPYTGHTTATTHFTTTLALLQQLIVLYSYMPLVAPRLIGEDHIASLENGMQHE
jgi:hypothetical protein